MAALPRHLAVVGSAPVAGLPRQPRQHHQAASKLSLAADFSPGAVLYERYKVVRLLGRGENSVTYRCRKTANGRT